MKFLTTDDVKNLKKDEKLYVLIGEEAVYKAQETVNGKWSWFDMTTSDCLASGEEDTFEELVEGIFNLQEVLAGQNLVNPDVLMEYDSYGEMVKDLYSRLEK